jgi:hypothetical protein
MTALLDAPEEVLFLPIPEPALQDNRVGEAAETEWDVMDSMNTVTLFENEQDAREHWQRYGGKLVARNVYTCHGPARGNRPGRG